MSRGFVVLLAAVALSAYGLGRSTTPPPAAPAAFVQLPSPTPVSAKAAGFLEAGQAPAPRGAVPLDRLPLSAQTALKPQKAAPAAPPEMAKPAQTVEVLTAAAIVALLIEESKRAYHAQGRPCACPDDRMRNGRACGGRSAYSRPRGAAPLCYPTDVSEAMIKAYRERRLAAR